MQEAWRETTEEIHGCGERGHDAGQCERRGCLGLEGGMEAGDWLRPGLKGKDEAVHHRASRRRQAGRAGEGNEAS